MTKEKVLGIKFDSKLHFWWSCKKAERKMRSLAPAISTSSNNLITAQWFCCLTAVIISIYLNDKRCLQLIQLNKLLTYEELLEKYGSVSVHHRNILIITKEMLQIKHGPSREIFNRSRSSDNVEIVEHVCEHSVL